MRYLLMLILLGCSPTPEGCALQETSCSLGVEVFECHETNLDYLLIQRGRTHIEVHFDNEDPMANYAIDYWINEICPESL